MRNHVCPWWLAYTFDNRLRRLFHKPEKICGPYVSEGMTVMDVGCGMGFFSIGLAGLVGDRGSVMAVDIQQEMLTILNRRADRAGLADRIRLKKSEADNPVFDTPVDFVLAFWMAHEVPDTDLFFNRIRSCLKSGGAMLIAEPVFHVSAGQFQSILDSARQAGLVGREGPAIRFSRSALLRPEAGIS